MTSIQAWAVRTNHETELIKQEIIDFFILKSPCLLQAIECLSQFARKIRAQWVFEARGQLPHLYVLNVTVQERSNDFPPVHLDVIDGDCGEHDPHRGEIGDRGIRSPQSTPRNWRKPLVTVRAFRLESLRVKLYMHCKTFIFDVRFTRFQMLFRIFDGFSLSIAGMKKSALPGEVGSS